MRRHYPVAHDFNIPSALHPYLTMLENALRERDAMIDNLALRVATLEGNKKNTDNVGAAQAFTSTDRRTTR